MDGGRSGRVRVAQRQAVDVPGAAGAEIVHVRFVPDTRAAGTDVGVVTLDAGTVMAVLR